MFSAEPTLEAPPRWGRRMPFVCLFDVENPLLDNDRVTEDLGIIGKRRSAHSSLHIPL